MISNYRPPRHEIEQDFLDTNPNPLDRNNAIVVGPAYVHADPVAANMVKEDFANAAEISYQYVDADGVTRTKVPNAVVDSAWSRVLGYNMWLQLYSKGTSGAVAANNAFNAYPDDRGGRVIKYKTADDSGFFSSVSTVPAANFDLGRSIQLGDILRVAGDKATVDRKVVGLAGVDIAPAVSGFGYNGAAKLVGAASAPITGVVHSGSTIVAGDITLDTSALAGDDLVDWARRYGSVSATAGIEVKAVLTVLTTGNAATATFNLVMQGRTVTVANASDLATGTDFTFLGETLNVDHAAWTAGETLTFYVALPSLAADYPLTASEVTLASAYNFVNASRKIATNVIIEVLNVALDGASVSVRISDTQGLMTPVGAVITAADSVISTFDGVSSGITLDLTTDFFNNCHVGQRLSVSITPPQRSTTVFDKVILDAPVGDILTLTNGTKDSLRVTAFVAFTGEILETEPVTGAVNFTGDDTALTLGAAVYAQVTGYDLEIDSVKPALTGKGQVAVAWRALAPIGSNETPFMVTGSTDIIAELGSYDLASELGFGLLQAVQAAGKGVYGLRVGGTDIGSWQAAIRTLATLRNVYTIAPMTDDEEVLKLFAAHSAEMNRPEIKKFRRVYASVDSPGEYTKFAALSDQTPATATITLGDGGAYTLVTFAQTEVDLESFPIYEGDKLRVASTGAVYEISYRGNDKTLVLKTGPATPISAATPVEIIAADTAENVSRYVWQLATRLGSNLEEDRRISCVWTDSGINGSTVIPNRFIAAQVAGYRVSLLPQQSLTRQAISAITDAPNMYSRFTEAQLNEIAANGVWIIMQDGPDLEPYCRHQLTTASSGGPLRYEDSAGVIYDFVSFAVDDIIDPLVGKRNVVRRTLIEAKNLALAKLQDFTTAPVGNETIGPMLAGFYDRDGNEGTLNVDFDPEFKDAIMLFAELEVPLTLNNARTRLLARTINTSAGASSVIVVG